MRWARDLVVSWRLGGVGTLGGFMLLYVVSKLIYLGLWCHVLCVVELYIQVHICLSCTYAICNTIQNVVSIVIV